MAFGSPDITIDTVAKAIATFERTLLSGNSAYDRYKPGRNRRAPRKSAAWMFTSIKPSAISARSESMLAGLQSLGADKSTSAQRRARTLVVEMKRRIAPRCVVRD